MKLSMIIITTFPYSGFIDHYPDLKLDPAGSGGMIYRKASVNLGSYDKIMVESIEVWMADVHLWYVAEQGVGRERLAATAIYDLPFRRYTDHRLIPKTFPRFSGRAWPPAQAGHRPYC